MRKSVLILLIASSLQADDNHVHIDQSGANMQMEIDQIAGTINKVDLSIDGISNSLDIDQIGSNNEVSWVDYWGSGSSWGGDLDGSNNTLRFKQYNTTGSDSNRIGFHIPSNGNTVDVCQGATFPDMSSSSCSGTSSEYGGHTVNLDLHSGGNTVKIGQQTGSGNADHYVQLYTYGGDNNQTFIKQNGNGNKTLNMTIRTDGGEQSIIQKDSGAHTATIDLTGSYGTDLTLKQQGSTNQSYSLTQDCQTSGGCSVSVTQGN